MTKRKPESVSVHVGKDLTNGAIVVGNHNVVNVTPPSVPITVYTPLPFLETDKLPTESDFLPPGSRLPFRRNRIFTGHIDDLKKLAQLLIVSHAASAAITQTAAATGMGGIGKTQLAVEFCYRYGRYFHGIHWINAREGSLDAEIAACGREMGLPNFPETTLEQVKMTLQAWQAQPLRLVVLDNLEQPQILEEWFSRLNGLHIIITARRQQWSADLGVEICPIGVLLRTDSFSLLRKLAPRLKDTLDADLNPLAERLGDLPLALDLAGRYLQARPTLMVAEYLQRLDETGNILEHTSLAGWAKDASPTDHETSLVATFLLSYQQLGDDGDDELARSFFVAASYLAPNIPIPRQIFYAFILEDEGDNDAEKIIWLDLSDDALMLLQQLGLLTESLIIHPLLAEFAQIQIEDTTILTGLAFKLAMLSKQINEDHRPDVFASLRPHLEKLVESVTHDDLLGGLWSNLGFHYHEVAEYSLAKVTYEKALNKKTSAYGGQSAVTAIDLDNLGLVLEDMDDIKGAKIMFEQALEIFKKHPRVNALELAIATSNLAGIYHVMGDLATAKYLFESALKIIKRKLGVNSPKVASGLNNLALIYKDMQDYKKAETLLKRAIRIDEKIYGKESLHIAISLHNLSIIHAEMNEIPQAYETAKQALLMLLKFLPFEHPQIQETVLNLHYFEQLLKNG